MISTYSSFSGIDRVMVFIDAGYLRKYCDEQYSDGICGIKYDTLANLLARTAVSPAKPTVVRIFYYEGVPNEKDAEKISDDGDRKKVLDKIKKKQTELDEYFKKIQDTDKLDIRKGHLVISLKEDPRQKGVDSQIAIDMITKAFQGQYDYAILLGGDADLIPIVEAVKHVGPNVMLAYFQESNYSDELTHVVDKRYAMTRRTLPDNGINSKESLIPKEEIKK